MEIILLLHLYYIPKYFLILFTIEYFFICKFIPKKKKYPPIEDVIK